jgi:hypothetical protein
VRAKKTSNSWVILYCNTSNNFYFITRYGVCRSAI